MENYKNLSLKESSLRSLTKAFIYRVAAIAGTTFLIWLVTRDIRESVSITIVVQVFLIILYYINERVWNKISWGREIKKQ